MANEEVIELRVCQVRAFGYSTAGSIEIVQMYEAGTLIYNDTDWLKTGELGITFDRESQRTKDDRDRWRSPWKVCGCMSHDSVPDCGGGRRPVYTARMVGRLEKGEGDDLFRVALRYRSS